MKVLGDELGTMIQKLHEEHGVIFHLEQTATSIDQNSVVLKNGVRLPALAVASVKQDLKNLKAEVAMEANDEAALTRMVTA